jgi:drug/metabolite transporter (DMT)-like permease
MSTPRQVWPVLAAAVLAISTSAVLVRFMTDVTPVAIATWRCVGCALLLAPGIRRVSMKDLLWTFGAGAFLAVHFVAFYASLNHTTVMRSTVFVCLGPMWVGLLEWLGGAPRGRSFWIGLAVAFAGVAAMAATSEGGEIGWYGDGLALLGGIMTAGYILLGRSVRQRVGIGTYASLVCASAAALLVPWALVSSTPLFGFDSDSWILLALVTAGPQLLGHNGFNYAVRWLPASTVTAFMLLEPVGATLLALCFLGEFPPWIAALGGFLVVVGVVRAVTD